MLKIHLSTVVGCVSYSRDGWARSISGTPFSNWLYSETAVRAQ